MFVTSVIAAGGRSERMGGRNKLLSKINGKPVFVMTVEKFLSAPRVNEVVLVVSDESADEYAEVLKEYGIFDFVKLAKGGKTRMESVANGLHACEGEADIVLIHDAARPLVKHKLIDDCIEAALEYGAACAAVPLNDTLKKSDRKGMVKRTIPREGLYCVQTPQSFMYRDILRLHDKAAYRGLKVTDDASIAEYFGFEVFLVESDYSNIKITTKEDLTIAEVFALNGDDAGTQDSLAPTE